MPDKNGETIENQGRKVVRTASQTAVIIAILTLGSKLLGFVRELVMAGFFGTSYIVDAYVMSQSIPSILFGGIFGAVTTSYMPLLSEKMAKGGQKECNLFTSKVLTILFVASGVSAIVGMFFSDQLTHVFANGFTGETAELTSGFLKVTFTYVMFTATAGIFEAYLRYNDVFISQVVVGYTQNIIVIITIIVSGHIGYQYLALGLLIAYIIRLTLIWALAKGKSFRFSFDRRETGEVIKQIARLALPVFIGSSVSQINLFVDKYLASALPEGSVSALNYATILNNMVMGFTVTIITTMIYPRMTRAGAENDEERFNMLIQKGLNLIIIISLPFALGAVMYHEQIVQVIFERGAFDSVATGLTGSAYMFYSFGMVFMALNTLLTQIYYSRQDMKTPVGCAVVSLLINIVFNLMLIDPMKHNGLALATAIANLSNTMALIIMLRQKYGEISLLESPKKVIKVVTASVISVGASVLIYDALTVSVWMPRLVYLGISVLAAVAIYLGFLKAFKIEELEFVRKIFKK